MRVRYLIPVAVGLLFFSVVVILRVGRVSNKDHFDDTVAELTRDELVALERDSKRAGGFIAVFVSPERRTDDVLEDLELRFAESAVSSDTSARGLD